MQKEQYREADVVRRISAISFGIDSAPKMQQQSHVQVVASKLYNLEGQRSVIPYSTLDRKMGTNSKDFPCETCGQNITTCLGHFGYVDLNLPVFHVGYFRNTINILQSICLNCAHVLLTPGEKYDFRWRLMNPNLTYMGKKSLRQAILDRCKKVSKCPNCEAIVGSVTRLNAKKGIPGVPISLKIALEMNKGRHKDIPLKEWIDTLHFAMQETPELSLEIPTAPITRILTPIDVLHIFERIPDYDIALLAMDGDRARPVDLILTRILVPPVSIRPTISSNIRAGTTEDDLTARIQEMIFVNDQIELKRRSGAPVSQYMLNWDFLQYVVAMYINSDVSGVPAQILKQKAHRGLVQRLKGKKGRFRGNLSGKRVDFSGRTVISPDPNLQIDQVGVPLHMAKILTFPELVMPANIEKMRRCVLNGPFKYPGAQYLTQRDVPGTKFLMYADRATLARQLKPGDLVERHLLDDDVVLFNRQPSLHKLSIMAHRVKVHPHKTLRFNECVCNPYNADFDGDEMNIHLPQTLEAKAEASILLGSKNNLVTPKNGELLIAPTQDFLTGAYLLSRKDTFLTFNEASRLVATFLDGPDVDMNIDLPTPCILKPQRLWSGKQIISMTFHPNRQCKVKSNLDAKGKAYTRNREFCVKDSYVIVRNSQLIAGTFDKGHLGSGGKGSNILYIILRDFGADHAAKAMWRLSKVTSNYLMNRGFSIGIGDVTPTPVLSQQTSSLLGAGYRKCVEYITQMKEGRLQCQPGCTPEETLESVLLKELSSIRDEAGQACIRELHKDNSPLIMALSGSKGSVINIAQMVTCVGQQALSGKRVPDGFENRSLPHFEHNSKTPEAKGFVENSFYSGLTPTEFFFHTMGGREGLVDTAVKTAETGYMQRRLVKMTTFVSVPKMSTVIANLQIILSMLPTVAFKVRTVTYLPSQPLQAPSCLEDLTVHYDGTVRNAQKEVVQVTFGGDGLDPAHMEGKDCPVDFMRVLKHVQAKHPYRNEEALNGTQIMRATNLILEKEDIFKNCPDFKEELRSFMAERAKAVDEVLVKFKRDPAQIQTIQPPVLKEIERLTCTQVVTFFNECGQKYLKAIVEPGTAVGALAAQSIGEPATQMTLKTFHFAGVASMNITQGVPRIQEIINASKNISTPIITAQLTNPSDLECAKRARARIEKTTLSEIAEYIDLIYDNYCKEGALLIQLDHKRIEQINLEVNADLIRNKICMSKLKLKPSEVHVSRPDRLIINPTRCEDMNFTLTDLQKRLPDVVVKGLPSVSRAVITKGEKQGKVSYSLCVEGDDLREVMATYGIDGKHTVSNNIMEIYQTLGIEAARGVIMSEIKMVMENHGMSVDFRHIMILAAQMTHTGEVTGNTRYGLTKLKESILNLASFEKTADHLFEAAYFGQTDPISGVSENIITGMPMPIGTGLFKLKHVPMDVEDTTPKQPLLFESAEAETTVF